MQHAQLTGYLALPPAGSGPGVLVLHAWWGLNDTARAFCARLAQEGFVVLVPDLYHGQVATTVAEAERLANALDGQQAKADVAAAVDRLTARAAPGERGIAVIGFSLGAFYALDLSVADPERVSAVVLYYGTGPGDYTRSRAAYLGHFAGADPFEPAANVDWLEGALREAGRPVTFYRYPGTGHWFCEPDRVEAYDEAAATTAWERTLAFLKEALASG
jgi:carboxymethylenebutenolidase